MPSIIARWWRVRCPGLLRLLRKVPVASETLVLDSVAILSRFWVSYDQTPDLPHLIVKAQAVHRPSATNCPGRKLFGRYMDTMHSEITILLVDDEVLILSCVSAALRNAGYNVLTALDPAEALHIGRGPRKLHALVTDVDMGKGRMNGVDLATLLQTEHPGLAVIVISGSAAGQDLAQERGFHFLAKPFTGAALAAR